MCWRRLKEKANRKAGPSPEMGTNPPSESIPGLPGTHVRSLPERETGVVGRAHYGSLLPARASSLEGTRNAQGPCHLARFFRLARSWFV